jgi:hypothetical protein
VVQSFSFLPIQLVISHGKLHCTDDCPRLISRTQPLLRGPLSQRVSLPPSVTGNTKHQLALSCFLLGRVTLEAGKAADHRPIRYQRCKQVVQGRESNRPGERERRQRHRQTSNHEGGS